MPNKGIVSLTYLAMRDIVPVRSIDRGQFDVMKTILGVLFGAMLCASSATASNIVSNPGFESGLAGWLVDSSDNWFIDTIPNTGSNDISTGCLGAGCLTNAFFFQDLSTVIGQSYDLSFWAFFEGGAPGEIDEIKVTWGGSTAIDIVNPAVPDDVYFQYSVSNLLATSSTTRLKFFGRDDPGMLAVDDISVSTPEPSTLLMISAGLLIVAGLRSRHLILSSIPAVAPSKRSLR